MLTPLEADYTRVLRQFVQDLPFKRDWLDPLLEREARQLISRAEAKAAEPTPEALYGDLRRMLSERREVAEGKKRDELL